VLRVVQGEVSRQSLQRTLGLKDAEHFRQHYLAPALAAGLIEMTLPDKPNSRLQKYRLTSKGRALLGRPEAR
jgi:ATP-dependent DNA helicase RecG